MVALPFYEGILPFATLLWLRYHNNRDISARRNAGPLWLANHVLQFPAAGFVNHLDHENDRYKGTGRVEPVRNRQTDELGEHGETHADEEIGGPLRRAADRQPRAPNLIWKHL